MISELLKHVAVIGAAGKMGSGISLLLLQEMAREEAESTAHVGSGVFRLHLVDSNSEGLYQLKQNLRAHLLRYAEKNIIRLREYFLPNPSLISNEEIIRTFVQGGIDMVRLDTDVAFCQDSKLIFEAVIEDPRLKIELFSQLNANGQSGAYYFTNTSSIPIHYLADHSGLKNRLIGTHFYNPPAVQKLLELIIPEQADPALKQLSVELAKRLGKIVVESRDVAGFIGNGHFIREIDYAIQKVNELEKQWGRECAILMIERVTKDFLIRPMGIFQLIDYVGIDVVRNIMSVMSEFLHLKFHTDLIDVLLQAGKKGGQNPDGSQKEGFYRYEQRKPVQIYSKQGYVSIPGDKIEPLPSGHISWKHVHEAKNKEEMLKRYFQALFDSSTLGAQIAQDFLLNSRTIAKNLVKDGVAKSIEDVDTVLIQGFFHAYGVSNI